MKKEDKELLLKDLCARLPYGVKFILSGGNVNNIYTMKGIDLIATDEGVWDYGVTTKNTEPIEIKYIKPYLRPMSSMTEEEKEELKNLFDAEEVTSYSICYIEGGTLVEYLSPIPYSFCYKIIDWLNKNMFDYRGLIVKGLALEAPEGMYN